MVRPFLAVLLAILPATAQEWAQWRGSGRTGIAQGFSAPVTWPRELRKEWSALIGGGFSTPVVSSSAIFVLTREKEEEVVEALDRNTGKPLWRKSYPASFQKNKYATEMGKGPNATPVYYQERLFTLGMTGVLSCFQAKTGALLWRKDFSKKIDTSNLFTGTAMSPLIEAGSLIVHIGDDRGGSLMALDPTTGNPRWNWDGDGPSYSSPIAATLDGVRQVIALTLKHAVGLDVRNGALLWRIDFKDQWNENIITPVIYGSRVIFSGVRRGTFALEVSRKGNTWSTQTAWENADITMYMSSPVLYGDHLYGLSSKRKGQFFCMDARSGKVLWITNGREGASASLVSAGDYLFLLNETGDLKVIRFNPAKFEPVAEYKVSDNATWPQPVILGSRILIKDANALTMYRIY